jgi:hypothetical protein
MPMPTEIVIISMLRAVVEIAGMFVLGQGLLWVFGPRAREGNFVYDLFRRGNTPIYKGVRRITPRFIHDRHIGIVTFLVLTWIWLGLGMYKQYACLAQSVQCA